MILALDEHDATIYTGDALKLCADVSPDSATNKGLLWMSSDPDVAAVDTNGNVKGLSVGSAEIVCTA
ncbi:Ig-like domain-containing protein, partial [Klebsiella pneumoniae]|uniref:Ig-like domain-containing protein n=1 Tax=Klebsiella pneumoniae TaxID=573 RepID=UPI0025A2D5A6